MPREASVSLREVGRSATILTAAAAAVQVVGIVREIFIAAQVGLSRDLDALLVALALPLALSGVLTSGTSTALVPAYVELRGRSHEDAGRWAGSVVGAVAFVGLLVSLLLFAFADVIVTVAGPGLDATARGAAAQYLRVLSPLAVAVAAANMLSAVCQADERFAVLATSSMAGSLATLVVTLALWSHLGLGALVVGSLVGPLLRLAVLLGAALLPSGAPRLRLGGRQGPFRGYAGHAGPLTLSAALLQLNTVADQAIATLLGPGAVSALRYADVLVRAPIGTIGPAWGAAIYPALVRATQSARSGLGSAADRSTRYILVVFVPIAVLAAAVAPLAVTVGYGRGAFDADDLERTAAVVAGFAPLIAILMVLPVLVGAHNARRDGRLLLTGGAMNVTLNVVLDVLLGLTLGVAGIALATSISRGIVTGFFAARLARSERDFDLTGLRRVLVLASAASLAAAVPIGVVARSADIGGTPLAALAALIACGVIGTALYGALATLAGLTEHIVLINAISSRIKAMRRPTPT